MTALTIPSVFSILKIFTISHMCFLFSTHAPCLLFESSLFLSARCAFQPQSYCSHYISLAFNQVLQNQLRPVSSSKNTLPSRLFTRFCREISLCSDSLRAAVNSVLCLKFQFAFIVTVYCDFLSQSVLIQKRANAFFPLR